MILLEVKFIGNINYVYMLYICMILKLVKYFQLFEGNEQDKKYKFGFCMLFLLEFNILF